MLFLVVGGCLVAVVCSFLSTSFLTSFFPTAFGVALPEVTGGLDVAAGLVVLATSFFTPFFSGAAVAVGLGAALETALPAPLLPPLDLTLFFKAEILQSTIEFVISGYT